MRCFARYGLLAAAVLAMSLLTISVGQRLVHRAAMRRALDNWDFPELAEHLNRAGLNVQLHMRWKADVLIQMAFLTTTDKSWEELNRLTKDPSQIQKWRGTVYCERLRKEMEPSLDLWDDYYLVAGPFVFFGDPELLERIRAILAPSASLNVAPEAWLSH